MMMKNGRRDCGQGLEESEREAPLDPVFLLKSEREV